MDTIKTHSTQLINMYIQIWRQNVCELRFPFIFFKILFTGLLWAEIKQLWDQGFEAHIKDMWNLLDFITIMLYITTYTLKLVAYYRVSYSNMNAVAYYRVSYSNMIWLANAIKKLIQQSWNEWINITLLSVVYLCHSLTLFKLNTVLKYVAMMFQWIWTRNL